MQKATMREVSLRGPIRIFDRSGRLLRRTVPQLTTPVGARLTLFGPIEMSYDHRDQDAYIFADANGQLRFLLAKEVEEKIWVPLS